jgi:hypothetical protein
MNIYCLLIQFVLTSTLFSSCASRITRNIYIPPKLENTQNQSVIIDTLIVKHKPVYTKSKFETSLSIVEVKNDSRCPIDLQCKWGGNAEVLLKIKHPNNKDTTFILNTHQKFESEKLVYGYNYKLIELTPYPKAGFGIIQANYKAHIIIEKRK